jgi:crotonobetainyl-CoA:carnitine CoA-transferase CaiB-like acyl-CoA transferase
MVVEVRQPGVAAPVRLLGTPVKLSRTPAEPARAGGPALGEHTDAVLAEAGFDAEAIERLKEEGAVAGPAGGVQGSFLA